MNHIKELKPDQKNARKHNPRNIGMIEKSLQEVGAARSIVIDEDNNILCGNGTIEAAGNAGITNLKIIEANGNEIIAVRRTGLTEQQKKKLALYDNRTAELADWNVDVLQDLSTELDLSGMFSELELEKLGFDTKEIIEDDVPKMPTKAKTIIGDLYELGNHRLFCGDSTNSDDVAKLMNGQKCDMVFTDPPYSVSYGVNEDRPSRKRDGKNTKIHGDTLTTEECSEMIWRPSFRNMYESAKDDCSFYMTMCQGGDQMMMMMMMMSEHWQIKHELIWVKSSAVFSMGRLDYDYQHEPILYGWKKKHNFYGGGEHKTSIWNIAKPNKSDLHPTMKPIELIVNAISNSSQEGNIVLDLFLGSGSTLIASEQTKRICYGMEIEPKYCDVIVSRYVNITGNNKIKLNGKEIFWEDKK